jgi:hypothetical protein
MIFLYLRLVEPGILADLCINRMNRFLCHTFLPIPTFAQTMTDRAFINPNFSAIFIKDFVENPAFLSKNRGKTLFLVCTGTF